MSSDKKSSFEDNMISTGEYLICVVYDQFGSAIEKGAGDSIGIKWLGKSFSVGPGIIISGVKHIRAGDSFRESLIDIGVDTVVGLSGPAAPFFVISKVANSASEKTEQYLLSYKDIHDLNAKFGDTSEEFERYHEQGIVNFLALLDRGVDFSKDKLNEYNIPLFGIMSLKDGTLSQLNSMAFELGLNLIESAKQLIANSPGGLFGVMSLKNGSSSESEDHTEEKKSSTSDVVETLPDNGGSKLNIQWFNSTSSLHSYLDTSIKFNPPDSEKTNDSRSSLEVLPVEPATQIDLPIESDPPDRSMQAPENSNPEAPKSSDLPTDAPTKPNVPPSRPKKSEPSKDETEIKPYFKITEKQIRAGLTLGNTKFGDFNAYFVFEGADDFISELGNRLVSHDCADEGKVMICNVKHKYRLESVGGHYKTYKLTLTNSETGVKSHKYARLKDFDIRSKNNRSVLQETFEVGVQRAIEKMYPQFYDDRARLIRKLEKTNGTQKIDRLLLFTNKFYDKYKAIPGIKEFIADIHENIERVKAIPNPQLEKHEENPKPNKKPQRKNNKGRKQLRVMGAFIESLALADMDQDDGDPLIERTSENHKLASSIEQLNSVYEYIFNKMQIAAERYQNGELDEEDYINLSQECDIDSDQFFDVAESIEANALLAEELKIALQNKKQALGRRHDSVLKHIISKKLDKIASGIGETDSNRADLLLLFDEIEQKWLSIEQKNAHSGLLLRKAELAFQLEEFGIAAESYIAVLDFIDDEGDEANVVQSQKLIKQLQALINLCEQLRDGAVIDVGIYEEFLTKRDIISEIRNKLADKQEEYRTTLENLSFIQLGIDLVIKLFEKYEKQKAKDNPQAALSEPYIEVIHSASSVTNQVLGVAKHQIGESLRQLDNPTFDTIKKLLPDMTPEEEELVRDLFNPELNNEAAKANYRDYFKKHGGTILYFKLAVATFELGIKSCYAVYFQRNSREEASPALSYEQWVSGNIWTSVTSLLSRAKVVSDALSQAQILNQLYSLISTGNISLNSVRDMFVSMMIFPHLSHYINEFTCLPGEKISTNEYAVFALSLLENMNEGIFQQILNTHDETSLNLVVRVLRKFERSSGAASWLYGQTMPILNGIFYARLTYHSYHASLQVYDRSLENRLENIRAYLQILESPELKHPTQQKDIKCHTALLYESIKYTAYSLSNTHPIRCNLYIIALYKQHQLNTSFEIATINNVTSDPIFQAISWYTDESPQELYQLIVSNSKKICADHSIESDNYPEAEMINILSEILGRPICVVEGIASTNFFSSDFPKWDVDNFKILRGDPIFIFYDTDRKRYHGLLARGELYVEQQLKKKFTSREHVIETSISFSTAPGTLQSRLSRLRDGMFRTGLAVAPVGTVSAQNTGVNQGSAQKSSTLKSGAF